MTPKQPKADKSQDTGHGANPTPDTGPEHAPADDGSGESEQFQKERVPSVEHEVSKP